MRASLALVVLAGCTDNVLPDPEVQAASIPREADVALGATHDVLLAGCQDHLSLLDLFTPAAVAALFVGAGRLDAAFYLPDALVQSAVPSCQPIALEVTGASLEGPGFALMTTSNPAAYHVRAINEGEARFVASVGIDDEVVQVSSTFRAWSVDRVEFAPTCDTTDTGAVDWVPAGATIPFSHRLFHGALELAGYGVTAASHDQLTIVEVGRSTASVRIGDVPGQLTLTSMLDPTYAHTLRVYTPDDVDSLRVDRASREVLFVGQHTVVTPTTTVAGARPCTWGFARDVTVETPTICELDDHASSALNLADTPITLTALAPGACRLRVELAGTAQVASLELTVFPGFQEVVLDESLDLSESLEDLWVAGPNDLVVVGYDEAGAGRLDGLIVRRASGAWQPTVRLAGSGTLRGVDGLGPAGPVWVVGDNGTAAVFNGSTWTVTPTGVSETLNAVWVGSANDAWAVGDDGRVIRWNGTSWSPVPSGTTARLTGVWGVAGGDPIVVGWNGTVLRMSAGGPQPVLPPGFSAPGFDVPSGVTGASANDLWIVDDDAPLHFDGLAWSAPSFALSAVDRVIGVWPVGDGFAYPLIRRDSKSFVSRFDGAVAQDIPITTLPAAEPTIKAIDGAGATVWVLYDRSLHRYTHDPLTAFP